MFELFAGDVGDQPARLSLAVDHFAESTADGSPDVDGCPIDGDGFVSRQLLSRLVDAEIAAGQFGKDFSQGRGGVTRFCHDRFWGGCHIPVVADTMGDRVFMIAGEGLFAYPASFKQSKSK